MNILPTTSRKNLFSILFFLIFSTSVFGQTDIFTSSGSFTVPCGVTSISVKVWGGGGAGGGSNSNNDGGEGGGAGGYSAGTVTVTPSQVITYIVGDGGDGGTGDGENGENSSFLTLTANGGNGGDQNGNSPSKGFGGTASGGTTNTTGGNGGAGGGDTGGNGGDAAGGGGTGGDGDDNGSGDDGNTPGGGGGGGERSGSSNKSGGDGGRGQIELTYTVITSVGGTANSDQNICSNNTPSDITLTGYQGSIQWQVSANNSAFSDVSGANSATLTSAQMGGLIATRYYRAKLTYGSCTIAYSSTVTVTVTTPPITTTAVAICTGDSGSLSASGACGSGSSISTGNTNSAATATQSGGSTGDSWGNNTNRSKITTDDNSYVTVDINNSSRELYTSNYGFNIPSNASITGVQVSIGRYAENSNSLRDNEVNLRYSGSEIATSKASSSYWPTLETAAIYGSSSDLWGATLTPDIINSSTFGVVLDVDNDNSNNRTAYVDYIQINITYTIGEVEWYTAPSGGTVIGTGTSFNPVGVAGSGLADTNTTGTTTYYAACSTDPGCRVAADFVVMDNNTVSAASSSPSVCVNTALTSITHTTTGATGIGAVTSLPTGVTASWLANIITISGTPTDTGTFGYSIPLTGGCGSVTAIGTITVVAAPTAPILGTVTQPDCIIATGSVVLTGLPSGSWVLYQNSNIGAQVVRNGSGSSYTVSGLASGRTYYFNVDNGSCLSSVSGNVTLVPAVTNIWDGSVWSEGTPNFSQELRFNQDYPPVVDPNVDIEGCSCKVTGSADVTIKLGRTMTITNEVEVLGSGTLTFENNASLVQINDLAANSGNINYIRTTTPIFSTDYVYWSSPVAGFTLGGIQTGTLYYSFNGTANSWVRRYVSTSMTAGMGYIVRGSGTGLAASPLPAKTVTFAGKPNNGEFTAPIGGLYSSNLIGNPYPSAIDADEFLTVNAGVLDGTLYFWTHNTAIQLASNITNGTAGSGAYAYTSDDYATYNLTGGTVAVSGAALPTGKIAAGQGFMATGFAAGNAVFNNSMRLDTGGTVLDNSQFFKQTRTSKTSSSVQKNRIWLNMSNAQGAFKQMLVGYITGATNDYDRAFDGVSYNGNKYIDFYSVSQNKKLVIQGKTLPFDENDEIPLGYSSTVVGVFSITIDEVDGFLKSQDVFLEDKLLSTIHDLKIAPYTFTTEKGIFNNRFVIRYTNKTLGSGDFELSGDNILISKDKNELKIKSSLENIKRITIFDLLGRKIFDKEAIDSNEFRTPNITLNNQTVIVKVTLMNGQIISKKVIY